MTAIPTPLRGLFYAATQGGRVAWYLGHYLLSARPAGPAVPRERRPKGQLPTLTQVLEDLGTLFGREWRDIERGLYRLPHDALRSPADVIGASLDYFGDVRRVTRRRRHGETHLAATQAGAGVPDYYAQAFHFQTDGYLSARSARLYDQQVEVLFLGGADAMRRRALPAIATRAAAAEPLRLLDLGAGTGRLLGFIADNFPRVERVALDLSAAYLHEARRQLRRWPGGAFVQGAAEAIPLAERSVDIVTAVYLFHELPAEVRRRVVAEAARVLRPGGTFVVIDTIQLGDHAPYDGLLDWFPAAFHEPYYAPYVREDTAGLITAAGFIPATSERAFLSKVSAFTRVGS
ncbi:MAG: class I SAM-dependent methyltransferase [Alphaproteobacteria bacterium]|nr:class I SAM-dependent methyltransferase [Alphaproteobacteria bacterium]